MWGWEGGGGVGRWGEGRGVVRWWHLVEHSTTSVSVSNYVKYLWSERRLTESKRGVAEPTEYFSGVVARELLMGVSS